MSPQQVYVGRGEVPRTSAPGRAGAPAIPPGHVQLYSPDPPRNLVLPLGPEPVKVSGGGGGWEVVGRPHQIGMTIWAGGEPYLLTLPLLLDNFAERTSVERSIRALERLNRGDDDSEPGARRGRRHPAAGRRLGDRRDRVRRPDPRRRRPARAPAADDADAARVRAAGVCAAQAARAREGTRRKTKVVKVKKGDTPAKIARRVKCKWTALRELNPGVIKRANQKVGKPGDKFKVGMKIRVPVKPTKPGKQGGNRGRRGGRDND